MSKSKTKKVKAPSPKKEIRNQITGQLKNALTGLEEKLGKKEFEIRVKKAARLLSAGIKTKKSKQPKVKAAKKENPAAEEKAE
jgi:hypothetical protein